MLAAMYGRPMRIMPASTPAMPPWYRRLFQQTPRHLRATGRIAPQAGSNGERIELPPTLAPEPGAEADVSADPKALIARYKLLALQQAERLRRGTSLRLPGDTSPLERDLFLLSESVAVDRALARAMPSIGALIARERTAALRSRPDMGDLTPAEREMEALIRAVLTAPPAQSIAGVPNADESTQSRAWAAERSRQMRGTQRTYRGLPSVPLWGAVKPVSGPAADVQRLWKMTNLNFQFAPSGGEGDESGDERSGDRDAESGSAKDSSASADSPAVTNDMEEAESASDARSGASRTETEEGPPISSAEAPSSEGGPEPLPTGTDASDFDATTAGHAAASSVDGPNDEHPIPYPEWDYLNQTYAARPALVRLRAPLASSDAWATEALELYAPVIRRLRERFDKLRARRLRLVRQRDGDELDMSACIEAYVDSRTGHAVGDRLYSSVRPARRALAIVLLVDISGSTDEKIRDEQRVIDVAKLALLIVTQALDALGDPYAIVSFSGRTRENVRMRMVKHFDDESGEATRRRIAGLAPEGYTRAGAAIRHATAMLTEQPAGHRLLLMLSDGKPNDDDGYTGRYAVEDTRQSILEAQGRGVHPYCLTIDRRGRDYLTRIFGESGHTILQHPEQLPLALADVIRRLLGARS